MADQPVTPWDNKFQDLAVAYLWLHPGAMAAHDGYWKPEYLTTATSGTLSAMAQDHWRKWKVLPTDAVMAEYIRLRHPDGNNEVEMRKRRALLQKLQELKETPLTDHEYISAKVREFVRFVALRNAVMEARDGLISGEYDPALPDKFRTALLTGQDTFEVGHIWRKDTDVRIMEATNPAVNPRIPTGLSHLDAAIGGGIQRGELGVLLALPKHFKSGTMMNFAYYALTESAGGCNVAYVTLELSERLVGTRFDLRCSMMTKDEMLQDPQHFSNVLHKRMDIICGDNDLFIKQFKTKTCSGDTIRQWLDQMWSQRGIKIDLLIVDYLDLMKSSRKREKDYLEAVDITEDLRSLCSPQEYNLACWTACRATREAVGRRRISMSHMSKAFERVGVADMVMALCQTEEEKFRGEMRIAPVAMRNDAGDRIINCRIDYQRMAMTSVDTSDPDFDDSEEDERPRRRSGGGGGGARRGADDGPANRTDVY